MSDLSSNDSTLTVLTAEPIIDEAHLAAAAFLARYSGRTLDAYRFDLRTFFQWASDVGLAILEATRPHIELYRGAMEDRGLAPSTIDRRLSTVCGFYRFAHIDGRVNANPAQYVRRPKVHPSEGRGLDRTEFGTFLFTAERLDRTMPPSPYCLASTVYGSAKPAGPISRTSPSPRDTARLGSWAREASRPSFRWCHGRPGPSTSPSVSARRADSSREGWQASGPAHRAPVGALYRETGGAGRVYPHMLRSAFIMAALDAGVPLRDVQIAARHADPRTTTVYDRRRENFDRHAAYVVVAFVAGG